MSFGFSVGDFIVVAQLANKIRQQFVDAPSQFKDISAEVRSLSIVLQDVEVVVPEREITSQQQTELHDIADGCCNVLTDLNNTLGKYQELDSRSKSFGGKARRAWKRLNWEPEDIKELRSRIVANTILLNAFQARLGSQISLATKDGVDRLHHRQDDQERGTILDWLTPVDYSSQQSDFIGRRQEGTGTWLLNSNEFQEWLNTSNQTLFCPGIPGAGKTMITSIVVDDLCTKFHNNASVGIAYLYCNYQPQQEQTPEDLLSSLLTQLAHDQPAVLPDIKSLYERHRIKGSRPSLDEITRAFHSTVQLYSRVFIVIDALDEYHVSNNEGQRKLLSEMFSLQGQTQLNLFATSRFVSEIISQFEGCLSKEIRAQDEDILSYVNGRIPQLLRSRISKCQEYSDLQHTIRSDIVKAVDGMFLLARLHMDSLMSQPTLGHIKRAMRSLPQGVKGLDETYEQAMKRIEGQEEGYRKLAKQALSWITHANRALSTAEVQHALAVTMDMTDLNRDFLPEVEILGSICAGLITIDEKSDIIRLVHYTTREYFGRMSSFPNADADIAMICVTYLSFDNFATGFCSTDKEFEARLRSHQLYSYAACNWGHHAYAAPTVLEQPIMNLLESEAKMLASSQAMMVPTSYRSENYSQSVPMQMTGMHIAAYFGLREVMIALLKNGHNPDVRNSYAQTPLSYAAERGHEAVVRLLLERVDVEANSKDNKNQTPLSRAAEYGYETVVKLLLKRADVEANSKDIWNQTPLSWAVASGHETVVKLLLKRADVEANSKDNWNRTPLSWAAESGHETVVKLLLERADVEAGSKDDRNRTPLSRAAASGHETVVKLLLERADVEADSKDDRDQTPLSGAAANGHEAAVKLLLERAHVEAVVKLLLERADVKAVVKLILERADVKAVVKLILERADVEAVAKLLLERADVEAVAKLTLEWVDVEAVVKLWLERVDVEAVAKLWLERVDVKAVAKLWLERVDVEAVAKLMLELADVEADSKDDKGRTPLSRAAANGHEAVVRLLLELADVEADSKDDNNRTPLWWAATNGHETVVRLLLKRADVKANSKDDNNQTPLWWAAANGHEAVVRLLQSHDSQSS